MSDARRARFAYEVLDVPSEQLACGVSWAAGSELPAEIVRLNAWRAVLRVPVPVPPPPHGAELELHFRPAADIDDPPFSLIGALTAAETGEEGVVLDVDLADWSRLREALSGTLRGLFNERRVERVVFGRREHNDIEVKVPGHPLPLRGWLTDISALGLGMHLPGRQVRHLEPGLVVDVRFYLPLFREFVETHLEIVHASRPPEGRRAGGEFRFARGTGLKMRRKLNSFVMRRVRAVGGR